MATNVYVDAFNLYYGCLKGTPYRALQSTFFKQIRTSSLAACQFPAVLADARGEIRKPAHW